MCIVHLIQFNSPFASFNNYDWPYLFFHIICAKHFLHSILALVYFVALFKLELFLLFKLHWCASMASSRWYLLLSCLINGWIMNTNQPTKRNRYVHLHRAKIKLFGFNLLLIASIIFLIMVVVLYSACLGMGKSPPL